MLSHRELFARVLEEAHLSAALLKLDLLKIGRDLAVRRAIGAKYNPLQPRVPAGNPDGGQWTDWHDKLSDSDRPDVTRWRSPSLVQPAAIRLRTGRPHGHRYVPRSIYSKLPLKAETRAIFEKAKTGNLLYERHYYSKPHVEYNNAVKELLISFLNEFAIDPDDMTPEQAREFLDRIDEARDPRIRNFNNAILRRELNQRFRGRFPRSEKGWHVTTDPEDDLLEEQWLAIGNGMDDILESFGEFDENGEKDYWILEDNWGNYQHKLYINSLHMISPMIVKRLQKLLMPFPGWTIVVALDVPEGRNGAWPAMGLLVRRYEIVDGLHREYLPEPHRSYRYPGSRPGTDLD